MQQPRIHLISLGCPKNRVDSEGMLGIATEAGYAPTDDPDEARVILVNTCGFIGPAQKESVDTILAMAERRRNGPCELLIVAGCLAQGHAETIAAEIEEVDHVLGVGDVERLGEVLSGAADRVVVGEPEGWLPSASSPRVLSSPAPLGAGAPLPAPVSAYVKLAEGCDRTCSFCIIPQLRGPQRSRHPEDLVREVQGLAARGVREVNLVAQDTAAYGRDQAGFGGSRVPGAALASLVERVADVDGIAWIRLLYLYPDDLAQPLVELLAGHPRVVPYVDMPFQHVADRMLQRMRRGHRGRRIRTLVERLRSASDELTFRTAFIVGHPGETAEDFDELCEFVRWAEFDRVALFRYSNEPGTRAHGMGDQVSPLVAANRARKLEAMGRRIASRKTAMLIDRELAVLVEGPSDEHEAVLMGRHPGQAPEIDGQIYLSTADAPHVEVQPGDLLPVQITQATGVDLVGVPLADGAKVSYLG